MLRSIRENIQGRLAKVILALIIIPFVFFGAESLLTRSGGSAAVLKVNGEKVPERLLLQEMQIVHRETLAQMGEAVDYALLEESALRPKALERLLQTTLLRQLADTLKMSVPDGVLEQAIVSMSAFQVDGKYSGEQMKLALADAGMPLQGLKDKISDGFRLTYFRDGIAGSEFLIDQDLKLLKAVIGEEREVEWIELPREKIISDLVVSSDDVQAYYDNNEQAFLTELSIVAEYLEIDQENYVSVIDEELVKQEYKKQLDQFIPDETREIAHILLEISDEQTEAQARQVFAEIQQKLLDGEDFFELAKRYSQDRGSANDGGRLGYIEQDGSFPNSFESAAFEAIVNTVTEPVLSDAGLHVIKVLDVEGTEFLEFDVMKEAIESQIQRRIAREKYVEAVERVADIAFNAADLSEPASQLDLEIKEAQELTANGVEIKEGVDSASDIFSDKRVLSALFSDEILNDGLNTEIIEINATKSVVLRVKKVVEPRLQSLKEVERLIRQQLLADLGAQHIKVRVSSIADKILGGQSFADLAKEEELDPTTMTVSRQTADVDPALLNQIFLSRREEVGNGVYEVIGDEVSFVFRVKAIKQNSDPFKGQMKDLFKRQARTFLAQQNLTAFVKMFEQSAQVEKF